MPEGLDSGRAQAREELPSTYTLPERSSRASAPRATLQGGEPEAETAAGVRAAAASQDTSPISHRPWRGSLRAGRGLELTQQAARPPHSKG